MLHTVWLARAAGSDSDVDGFRKFLVAGRHLTDYQAALIQRGHTEGFLVGGYVILDRIGKGASAGVYKAVHPGSGQVVALKVLPASRARKPQTLARFQREGRLLTQLNHANVVRAFHVGSSGGAHFIVMEHLEGETLNDVLSRRRQLPYGEAVRLSLQALNGLQHLHDRKKVHRDLKPSNLMLVPASNSTTLASTVKILDIGLGRDLFDETVPEDDERITMEGTLLGTPDYLAPEQARDARSVDIRADIYSLGCVLFHMLAGRPPFVETNMMAAMVRHATEPPPDISELAPGTPPGLAAVLNVLLAKKARDRFAIPQDAADALLPYQPEDSEPASESRIIPAYAKWLQAETREPTTSIGGPMSSTVMRSPRLSGPVSSTRLRPGFATESSVAPALPPTRLKPPTAPPKPAPNLIAPTDTTPPSEADVELMPLEELQARIVYSRPERALWELDRRDAIMLAIGAVSVIIAIGIGIFAAKFNSAKIRRGPDEDE